MRYTCVDALFVDDARVRAEHHSKKTAKSMKSPFPGMNPYLEQPAFWSDFHATFTNYWREAVADLLPPGYEATIGERVYLVESDPDERKLGYPDVAVTRHAGQTATLEPVTIPLTILEGPRETYIEILYQPDHSLVTALELLSPANKQSPGRVEYLAKRRALLLQRVHLVELDLLLGGRRLPFERPLPTANYYYFVARGELRPDCQVYHWTLRDKLPILPIPLRDPDPDIYVDLGAVFATAYERGRFYRRIDYRDRVPSFIGDADLAWVQQITAQLSEGRSGLWTEHR